MKTTGNTMLITGAGTGMGLAAAKAFATEGNKIIMVARDEQRLHKEAGAIKDADPIPCDLVDEAQVNSLVERVATFYPKLNMLFLNAGVTHTYKLFSEGEPVAYAQQEMDTNYISTVRMTTLFEPILRNRENPAIIITTSGVIYAPDTTNPTYSSTKAALHSYIQTARYVLGKAGSKIKWFELIAPLVDSPFAQDVKSSQKVPPEDVIKDLIRGLEADEEEIRPGLSGELYKAWRESPQKAFDAVNSATGA